MKFLCAVIFVYLIGFNKEILHWIESHLLTCGMKSYTGLDCPGCGIQRSIIELFKGDLISSFKLYPATLPLLFLIVFAIVHLKFNFKKGASIIKILYLGIAVIVAINYIYKIFTNQLI